MAVGIIQGIAELIEYEDYISSARVAQYFTSYSDCYEYMLQNAYKSGSSAAVRGIIDGGRAGASKIVEFQPRLTGGTKAGVDVANVTENGEIIEFTSGEASMGAIPVIEAVGAILAGLGVGILSYEANKDFWIDVSNNAFQNFPGYEPITYDNIEDMSLLTLFKDNKTYIDAEVIQNINNYLIEIGAFDSIYESTYNLYQTSGRYVLTSLACTFDNIKGLVMQCYDALLNKPWYSVALLTQIWDALRQYPSAISEGTCFTLTMSINNRGDSQYEFMLCDITIWTTNLSVAQNCTSYYDEGYVSVSSYNFSNYERRLGIRARAGIDGDNSWRTGSYNVDPYIGAYSPNGLNTDIYTSSLNNTVVIEPKIEELPALEPRTISTTPNSIPTEMPDWWQHILEIGDIDPDTMTRVAHEFLPLSVPNNSPYAQPVTTPQADIQTGNVPATNPTPVGDSVLPLFDPTGPYKPPSNPTPPSTSTPVIPGIPAIGGQANALFTVYNPSQANLNSLGAVLWTQNIIEQIVQMFTNNPMDAIISLHILYATPATGSNKEIKLGYLPTGVSCPEVTNQYINLDCGTVRVPELYGDIRDYACTDISIFLPMVGFRQLKTEDAMASNISVDYKIDVFTGTVLANVIINRGSVNQVFYTFEGNCAVNLPLTGADKSRQLATVIGAAGAIATGNPALALGAMGAFAGGSARAQIQRSGNFTGNAGAMGCKKPYIVVSSDIAYDAVGYNSQYGFPANLTVMLGTCHGYVKAKEVHADTIANATEVEKREIESQLKQGIIIH